MSVYRGELGRRRAWAFRDAKRLRFAAAALLSLTWMHAAHAQQPYYVPDPAMQGQPGYPPSFVVPASYPYHCPPFAPCPTPGYPPGMAPAYPPGYAPTYPPGARPAPRPDGREQRPTPDDRRRTEEGERTEGQTQDPAQDQDQDQPDLPSPTADVDAAAADAAADVGSLSGATGTPSAPASATPNSIGDFFGAPPGEAILTFPSGFVTLNFNASGTLLALGPNGAPTSTPAQLPAVVDPVQTPGQIFVGSAATNVALTLSTGQTIIVPASFVSSDSSFSLLPGSFPLANSPALQSALQSQLGAASASINPSGENTADVVQGEGTTSGLATVSVDYFYTINQPIPPTVIVPLPDPGGALGTQKIADNNSARPQNRFFLDFQYFEQVPLEVGGVDVRKVTLGFERMFVGPGDLLSSFEFRVPTASTLSTDIIANGPNDLNSGEYGNVLSTLKFLIYDAPMLDLATGFRISLPTADDVTLSLTDGTPLAVKENESIHFVPYVAGLYESGGRVFMHAFANVDFDLNGNPVLLNPDRTGLREFDRLHSPTLLYLDGSFGYWLYRNPSKFFYGLASMAELHYNKTLESAEEVGAGNVRVGNRNDSLDLLNATLGVHGIFGLTTITNGVSFPITRSDRLFDWEYRFFVNRHF